jgi:GNAT superfamily N-acetyltransferase
MPEIRRLPAERDPAAEALLRAAFADYARRLGREQRPGLDRPGDARAKGGFLLGLEENGDLLAVALLHPDAEAGAWFLAHLGVSPEAQGRALGARLLAAAEAAAADAGAERIALRTAAMRDDLIGFYARRGWRITRRGPPEHGLDAHERVRMEKTLTR